MPFAEEAIFDRSRRFAKCLQRRASFRLIGLAFLPSATCFTLPGPPVLAIRLPVERAAAGDGDVGLLESINKRRVVHALGAFPTRKHDRQIVFRVLAERSE